MEREPSRLPTELVRTGGMASRAALVFAGLSALRLHSAAPLKAAADAPHIMIIVVE